MLSPCLVTHQHLYTGSQGLRAVFAEYDADGSGTMDAKELTALLKDLEFSVRDESTVRFRVKRKPGIGD